MQGGCRADREAAAVPPQNQQETKQASEKPTAVSALFTPRLGFCCWVGTRGQGTSSIPPSVAGHCSTHGKGHHPGLRHPQRRRAEPTQPGKPLEGPWASRMPLTWGMGPGRGFGVKETPLIFWQRQTGDLSASTERQGLAPALPAAPLLVRDPAVLPPCPGRHRREMQQEKHSLQRLQCRSGGLPSSPTSKLSLFNI